MIERYSNRMIAINQTSLYEEYFRNRGVRYINHYETPNFVFPKNEEFSRIATQSHVWKIGDRFFKLAYQYYGDSRDWWVIAKFNNKPTDSHVNIGELITIPVSLQEVLRYMKG